MAQSRTWRAPAERQARIVCISVMLAAILSVASLGCDSDAPPESATPAPIPHRERATPQPAPRPYRQVLADVRARRDALAGRYRAAATTAERRHVLNEARHVLVEAITRDIAPRWLGTPWAFHGTSETPGTGAIACGYFVSTVLRDAGLRVERVRLARQPAERIILSLTGAPHVRRFSNASLARFVAAVRACGEGVYVVGLDYHVGLLTCGPEGVFFVHSQGVAPKEVVRERAAESPVLGASRYRVFGRISADDALIEAWLTGRAIRTRTG